MLVVRESFHLGDVVKNVGETLTAEEEKGLRDKIAAFNDSQQPNFKPPAGFDIQQVKIAADDASMKISYCVRVADRPVQPVASTTPLPTTAAPVK